MPNITASKAISELHLQALYDLLPDVSSKVYMTRFSKELKVWRESLHPPGIPDIRVVDKADGLTYKVNLGDHLGCDIYYGHFQEFWDHALFMALIFPGAVVVDIGANYGMYALSAGLRVGENGRVIAFEPDERAASLLKENVRLNHLESHIIDIKACIGDRDGETGFYSNQDSSFSSIHQTLRSELAEVYKVPIRTLDSMLGEFGIEAVDLVKIDVEGNESEVLRGASVTLARSDAVVMVEVSQKHIDDPKRESLAAELKCLELVGYVAFWMESPSLRETPHLNSEVTLTQLVKPRDGVSTINYFLVKRMGKHYALIPQLFHKLRVLKRQKHPSNQQAKATEVELLQDKLWAKSVEQEVSAMVCNKFFKEMAKISHDKAKLEQTLAVYAEKLNDRTETNAKLKTMLVEAHRQINHMNSGILGVLCRIIARINK